MSKFEGMIIKLGEVCLSEWPVLNFWLGESIGKFKVSTFLIMYNLNLLILQTKILTMHLFLYEILWEKNKKYKKEENASLP